MILYVTGNLFQSPAQVLVNTVNTVGVMGKGVAYEFKRLYPEMFEEYRSLCESGQLTIGKLWLYKSPNKWVLNFPTKKHWRQPSRVEYVQAGLEKFIATYEQMGIHSIAFPPLGCGNGQLDFETQVRPLMEQYLRNLPIDVFIYPDRDDPFIPEHEDPAGMREWLRSEPTSLPFSEVWDDLKRLLNEQNTFKTVATGSAFTAAITDGDEDPFLEISASGNRYRVPYETLMAFWQQLRTHGFSMRSIAPDLKREIYYLTPIFASLDYVKPVRIADEYSKLMSSPVTGLQVLPQAFSRRQQPTQLPLFALPS